MGTGIFDGGHRSGMGWSQLGGWVPARQWKDEVVRTGTVHKDSSLAVSGFLCNMAATHSNPPLLGDRLIISFLSYQGTWIVGL